MTRRKLTIPVSDETYDLLQQLAYEQGQSLAAFCRDRIMAKENMAAEFGALQRTLAATIHEAVQHRLAGTNQGDVADVSAMTAEVLLLLRSMVPPQKMQAAHGELRRIGMEPFVSK